MILVVIIRSPGVAAPSCSGPRSRGTTFQAHSLPPRETLIAQNLTNPYQRSNMLPRMSNAEISDVRALALEEGWLSETPSDFQSAILERCVWQRILPGVALTHGGDSHGGLVGLIRGRVDFISAIGPSDTPIAHIARAPFWFGELPVAGRLRTTTVISRTVCDIALVPQLALEAVLAAKPDRWRLLGTLSARGIFLVTLIATDLLIRDSQRRCVAVLLRIAGCRKAGTTRCEAEIGQDELADMANMSRQTVGVVLRTLEAQGAVKLGYRSITITDPVRLRAMVDV